MPAHPADVTIHIDQELGSADRALLMEAFRQREGVISARFNEDKRHLVICEFDSERVSTRDLLAILMYQGYHGKLVGL
jgi:hypothetical protein